MKKTLAKIRNKYGSKEPVREFKDFILSGHSFGGYIAGCYALKYQQNLKKLLLLSPIGYKPKAPQEEISEEDLDKKFRILKTHPWWFIEMMRFSWVN